MKSLLLLLLMSTAAYAQSDPRNSVTFGGGYGRDVNAFCCQADTAVSLGVTYGYRFRPFLQAEVGVATALNPVPAIIGANYNIQPNNRFIWVPFGVRGILPLHGDRVELSLAAGGLYETFNGDGLTSRNGWGEYFSGSAAVALDRGRHFWLGASPRFYLANTGGPNDRWFVITGDVSFRF
jgi:hypothetical protein